MAWIMLILFVSEIWLVTSKSDHYIDVTNSDCGSEYDADNYNTIHLDYRGSDILRSNPCHIEFTKDSYDQYICVSASEVSLDCDTKLEYHEAFVKNYIDPEKKMSCYDTSTEEWCPSQYQDNIFIVIRKPEQLSTDRIKLRVYLKDVPEDSPFSGGSSVWIYSLIAPVLIIVVVTLVICARLRARQRAATQTQVRFQTTTGTANLQTSYAGYQPAPQTYYPPQQYPPQPYTTPPVQGNYHVHPMQSAYPVTEPQNSEQQGMNLQQHPSAPPMMSSAAPPPSYDSVVGKNY